MSELFEIGSLTVTGASLELMKRSNTTLHAVLTRHLMGDWGDLGIEDCKTNDLNLARGQRVMSEYALNAGKVWVISKPGDHTTVMLPVEVCNG